MQFDVPTYVQLQALAYVGLAMLLGALVGVDREMAHKPAGLRTHMLVSGASALLVALGEILVQHFDASLRHTAIQTDPLRVMGAVITGVSFLGAGTIIRHDSDDRVEGITTAASLLMAAAVGITVALSQLVLAVGLTLFTLMILRGLNTLTRWIEGRGADHTSHLER
jgi:putative Mg2+ transporter-C (MgtC) family protein